MNAAENDTKEIFSKCGMCSHTLFHLLNREFGHEKEQEERASDPLAGGIAGKGYQCGMLWGAALGAGAESFRRCKDHGQAVALAVTATQHIIESFVQRTKSANCRDITGCDLASPLGMMKFGLKTILTGMKNSLCFNLAEQWAPEAIQSASEGLSRAPADASHASVNCACEVAKKMGAGDEEMVTVAGLAGGIGLSGNACGALGAVIWLKALEWCKKHPGKRPPYFNNPTVKNALRTLRDATGQKILCHEIAGRRFTSIDDHAQFISSGGCGKLIDALALV